MSLVTLMLLLVLNSVYLSAAQAEDAELLVQHPDRDFAYVIGDVLEQKIALPTTGPTTRPEKGSAGGAGPDLSVLSSKARVSDWLERQNAVMVEHSDRHWLVLRYQIVNSPLSITRAQLPALSIAMSDGNTVDVQAWPFDLGPLTSDAESVRLKPDGTLQPLDGAQALRRAMLAAIALVAILIAWLLWWLWRINSDKHRLPFAHALSLLKRKSFASRPESLETWAVLHHAFNASAGRVVTGSNYAQLIERVPWLDNHEASIHAFFNESRCRFFKSPPTSNAFDVIELARQLAAEEKRSSL